MFVKSIQNHNVHMNLFHNNSEGVGSYVGVGGRDWTALMISNTKSSELVTVYIQVRSFWPHPLVQDPKHSFIVS